MMHIGFEPCKLFKASDGVSVSSLVHSFVICSYLHTEIQVSKNLLWCTQATSAGLKDQEAINFLEKKMKNDPSFTYEETVQVVLFQFFFLRFYLFSLRNKQSLHWFFGWCGKWRCHVLSPRMSVFKDIYFIMSDFLHSFSDKQWILLVFSSGNKIIFYSCAIVFYDY